MPNLPHSSPGCSTAQTPTPAESAVKSTPSLPDSRTNPAGARRARDTRVTNTEGTAVAIQNRDQPKPQQQGTP